MEEIRKNLLALWKGLTLQQRITLIASFVLSLVVLGAVVYFASKPKLTLLFGGLAPAEASKIIEYLDSKSITYEVNDGGRAVMVPDSQVYTIRMGLAAQGIPSNADGGGAGLGFELFDRPTFGMSDFMQRANYYRALEGELARTIRQLEEVQNARVLIVVPEDHLFGQTQKEAKASVFLQLQPGRMLGESQVRAIRFLVSNGVEGLQPERVSVVDNSGRALAESDDALSGENQEAEKRRKARADLENYLQDKAQSMLDQVLGPGQAVVRVAAEIDYDKLEQTTERYDPKNAAIRKETITTEDNTTHAQESSAGAGVTANTSSNADNGKASSQKRQDSTNEYELGKTVENREVAVGSIKRLTIALMLNQKKAATPGAPPLTRSTTDIAGLENLVKAAVGYTKNDTRDDLIQTQEVAFADLFGDDKATTKSSMPNLSPLMPYVTQGFLILLAVGIVIYFRSIFLPQAEKETELKPDSFEFLLRSYQNHANGGQPPETSPTPSNHGRLGADPTGILTPEELSRLIRENPTNTSQAFKAWLRRN